jgi:cytoskeletal protein RodZ
VKKSNNQTGSAHVVIIVILVLAVLGLLGFVFWQNFVNKKATTADTTTNTAQQSPSGTVPTADLAVSEWGVTGSYSKFSPNLNGLNYQFKKFDSSNKIVTTTASDAVFLTITSPALDALCTTSGGVVYISRNKGDVAMSASVGSPESTVADTYNSMTVPNGSYSAKAHVGDYYYFLSTPQGTCSDNSSDTSQKDVLGAAEDFLKNLKKI